MTSYYQGLPIYRAALDCAVAVDGAALRFPKGHKYTLGARLRDTAADILLGVARANRREGRAQALGALCDRIEDLKLLLNLGKEVKAFSSFQGCAQVVNQVVSLPLEESEPQGNVKKRRLAYLFEPLGRAEDEEKRTP